MTRHAFLLTLLAPLLTPFGWCRRKFGRTRLSEAAAKFFNRSDSALLKLIAATHFEKPDSEFRLPRNTGKTLKMFRYNTLEKKDV